MPTRSRANKAAVGGRTIGRAGTRQAPRLPARGLLIYGAAMFLLWLLVTLFSASTVMAVYNPARAVSLNPFNASAKAQVANDLVYVTGDKRQIAAAATLAREALDGNATIASAYRMIGLENARRGKPVKPAIMAATYLTRRDHIANLWLIEDAVKRRWIDLAMTDVDASLRSSRRSQALLFPILGQAMSEPDMRPQFIRLFRANPDWLPNFLGYYIGSKQKAAPLAQVILPIRKDLPPSYAELDRTLIGMMVSQQDFDAARNYARAIDSKADGDRQLMHNARFEEEGPFPPIDWHLIRESAYGSDIEKGAKGNRLIVVSDQERPNVVARQLIQLAPGTYRLSAEGRLVTSNDDASAVWTIACAEKGGTGVLASVKFARGAAPSAADFTIAGPCRNYWVSLTAAAGFGSTSFQAEFRQVLLQPVA